MKDKIVSLLKEGFSYSYISNEVGCSHATISYHAKKLGLTKHNVVYDWSAIKAYYDAGYSYSDCMAKFGFSSNAWHRAVTRGDIVTRRSKSSSYEELLLTNPLRKSVKLFIIQNNLLNHSSCACCGVGSVWNGKPLTLQLDHINGINDDHRLENLRFVCPNCHSQTDTFCSKNRIRK